MVIKKKSLLVGLTIIIFLGIISSNIEIGEPGYSISKNFYKGSNLGGWINISLENENSDIELSDSQGNSIKIRDILLSENYSYECEPFDCGKYYESKGSYNNKNFDLSLGDSVLLGFLFSGKITNIESLSFKINSDAAPSCQNQITLDFLDDNENRIVNYKTNRNKCDPLVSYGCYVNVPERNQEYNLVKSPKKYCQRISFPPAPAYEVGSFFKGESKGPIYFEVYNLEGNKIENADCTIDRIHYEGGWRCFIKDFSLSENKEYYLCINSLEEETDLSISGYPYQDGCGFYWQEGRDFPLNETAAYQLFVQGLEFDTPGDLLIEIKNDQIEKIISYISKKYSENLDCYNHQCIVPLNIKANTQQNIEISDINVKASTTEGIVTNQRVHELDYILGKISFPFQKINLGDINFTLPDQEGNFTYKLNIGNTELFNEDIRIEGGLPKVEDIFPFSTFSSYPTNFNADVTLESGITSYKWEFGDGAQKTTTTSKTEHIYSRPGDYNVKLSITNNQGVIDQKTSQIEVKSSINFTKEKIESMQNRLQNIKSELQQLESHEKNRLNLLLEIDNSEDSLREIQQSYENANTQEEYHDVALALQKLSIPETFIKSRENNYVLFFPLEEKIDIDAVSNIFSEELEHERESYKRGLMGWMNSKLDMSVSFKEYSILSEGNVIDKITFYKIKISEKEVLNSNPYLIIDKKDFEFDRDYGQNEEGRYIYLELKESQNEFIVSSKEINDFMELPLFISPELSLIPIDDEDIQDRDEPERRWGLFALVIIFILILGLGVYIVLQEWYKHKYEEYLFGSKNDLYNLLVYIHNSKIKGIKKSEIESKLMRAGWASEQLRYAIRKYEGKRTGMIEIPIDRILRIFRRDDPRKKIVPGFNKNMPPIPKKTFNPQGNPGNSLTKFPNKNPNNLDKKDNFRKPY